VPTWPITRPPSPATWERSPWAWRTRISSSSAGSDSAARRPPRAVIALGWAGLLPFAALALLAWLPGAPLAAISQLFLIYALAITAFLAGTVWGRADSAAGSDKVIRLCVSNAFVLVGAAALAFAASAAAASIFLILFWAIFAFEWMIARRRGWYLRYRLQLTIVVSLCHALFIAAYR
jgi:hypothetical protein